MKLVFLLTMNIVCSISAYFSSHEFPACVHEAVRQTKQFLHDSKFPVYKTAPEVSHVYEDKYLLSEFLTRNAAAASLNVFRLLGMQSELQTLTNWANNSVSIHFTARRECELNHWAVRDVESPNRLQTEGFLGFKTTTKTITTVNESFWDVRMKYEINAVQNSGAMERLVLLSGSRNFTRVTENGYRPLESLTVYGPHKLDITWLLKNAKLSNPEGSIDTHWSMDFAIDTERLPAETET